MERQAWKGKRENCPRKSCYLEHSVGEYPSHRSLSVQAARGKEAADFLPLSSSYLQAQLCSEPQPSEPEGTKASPGCRRPFCCLRLSQSLWLFPPHCYMGIFDCLMGFSITDWSHTEKPLPLHNWSGSCLWLQILSFCPLQRGRGDCLSVSCLPSLDFVIISLFSLLQWSSGAWKSCCRLQLLFSVSRLI